MCKLLPVSQHSSNKPRSHLPQLQWQGTYPTPRDACGSWSSDCKKSSGNCKMKSQEIQWDWKLDTQLNVFPFPWQLMRGKPRRILCQLWARMGMWFLSWNMGAASYKEEGASLDGIKHIPCLCEAPLGFWLIILVDFSFYFFFFFLVCPLAEEATDSELSISPKKWVFLGVAVISRQKWRSSVFTVINIHPSALKSAVYNKCKKLNILLLR